MIILHHKVSLSKVCKWPCCISINDLRFCFLLMKLEAFCFELCSGGIFYFHSQFTDVNTQQSSLLLLWTTAKHKNLFPRIENSQVLGVL